MTINNQKAIRGALLGTALGDAVGLVTEGLSRRRLARLYPGPLGPALWFRFGMMSDDGEHACMTAQALIVASGDTQRFIHSLAWRLRFWLLGFPAGVGLATGRAILKLWIGFSPHKSGVFSAGNGPAMRAPIIGAAWSDHLATMKKMVVASTRLTHTDPKAEWGALAVALAAAFSARGERVTPQQFVQELTSLLDKSAVEFVSLIEQTVASLLKGETAFQFADNLGLSTGIGGYVFHTVPIVLHIWMRSPASFEDALNEVIRLGGDTDTTAAILGGILGAGMDLEEFPKHWVLRLVDWPRSRHWMISLADRLARVHQTGIPMNALPLFWPLLPLRNLVFLTVVLLHGVRRLFPPW
ncbi:MAG: ADP-ribosylglycohydrolase family protein [Magnetococcus sp. DMHC-6]